MESVKRQFPIFKKHRNLVYLDSAATALTPQPVIDKMNEYYIEYGASINRGLYDISDRATQEYEAVREKVANFVNANADEIVFTSGTTHGLNMLASSIGKTLKAGDNVVLTEYEHHGNLIPWQEASKRYRFELRFILLDKGSWKLETGSQIDENTKVVTFPHVSNSLGSVSSAEELIVKAKKVGAITIVDAAQSVVHMQTDVKRLDCDFLVFSGHKVYGPTGVGVLYGKKERLETLDPFIFGGDMVDDVSYSSASWNGVPHRFESGTPNIAGVIGLGSAIDFVEDIGFEQISKYENELTNQLINQLTQRNDVSIVGPQTSTDRAPVVSFTIDGIHPHDIAEILNRHNVAIRAGHHCTMPLMKKLGISGTARISFGLYNTEDDVDNAVEAIHDVISIFRK
ncbi:MAG: cysteine desulfurase [Candidatus Magasanikbacteria bacterium CG11_big_fil_rev_8_21_14_0_20_43_7]|uniref:Cysteine desulfurase n=1 Tax=Candidatus Magasanikbacteria bacterium CG11_big_fil_rev_8_21_14_0_20_43_7 TaxID=1974654 RepID=A0A2H0N2A1_9BACT|nr:MAG: cysteine desulfurase [Candidatus Magasanikbacteria bacterium CG11_big_fil_rev_8_21_14_0_20_43_7]